MAKEIKMKQATQGSGVNIKEQIVVLMNTGEVLGNELIDMLSQYGCSHGGLLIETYAMSKAWAALRTIAHRKGYDADDLFEQLLPSFMKDMEGVVDEMEEEKMK